MVDEFDDPPKRFRVSRLVFLGVPATLLVLVGGLLVAPSFVDWNAHKGRVESLVKTATGLDLRIAGSVSAAILPAPHATLGDVTLSRGDDTLLTLKELEARVSLIPLFSGKVEVTSLRLIEPEITLTVSKSGEPNWETPELLALQSTKTEEGEAAPAEGGMSDSISLSRLAIQDGRFSYADQRSGRIFEVDEVTTTLRAESLKGPYALDGSVRYAGKPFGFEATVARFSAEADSVPIKAEIAMPDADTTVSWSGTVAPQAPYDVQGEFSFMSSNLREAVAGLGVDASSLPRSLSAKAEANGTLTWKGDSLSYKNMRLSAAGLDLSGEFALKRIGKPEGVRLDASLSSDGVLDLDSLLPPQRASGKDAKKASAGFLPEGLGGDLLPVDGRISLNAPGVIYNTRKAGATRLSLSRSGDALTFDLSVARTPEGGKLSAAGTLGRSKGSAESVLKMDADLSTPDLPQFSQFLGLETGSLPVKALTAKGHVQVEPKSVRLTMGKFTLDEVPLSLEGSYTKPGDGSFDLSVNANAADAPKVMQALGLAQAVEGAPLSGPADLVLSLSGTEETSKFSANLKALSGTVEAAGTVRQAFSSPQTDDLTLRIKHPDTAKAIRIVSPDFSAGPAWSSPMDVYAGVKRTEDGTVTLSGLQGNAGPVSLKGDLTVATSGARPSVSGKLQFGTLPLDQIFGSASGSGKGGKSGAKGGGHWSSEPFATGWMHAVDADLAITAGKLTQGEWVLDNPALNFTLKDGLLTIGQLDAGLFGGQVGLQGTLKDEGGALALDGSTKMAKVDVRMLVNALMGRKADVAEGALDRFELSLSGQGASQAALVSALQGNGEASGANLILKGVDMARLAKVLSSGSKPGDTALGLLGSAAQGGQTRFDTFEGNWTIKNGIVSLSRLFFEGQQANLTVTGSIDLPRWSVDLSNEFALKDPPDAPPFKMSIRGSLDNPAKTFGQGAIEDYIQRKLSKKLEKVLTDKIGGQLQKKFGVPLLPTPAPEAAPVPEPQSAPVEETAPASGDLSLPNLDAPPAAEQPAPAEPAPPEEIKPEDAVRGILQNLIQQ